jgi:hypothetical protein
MNPDQQKEQNFNRPFLKEKTMNPNNEDAQPKGNHPLRIW